MGGGVALVRCSDTKPARSGPVLGLGGMCTNSVRDLCISKLQIYSVANSINKWRAVNVATVALDAFSLGAE